MPFLGVILHALTGGHSTCPYWLTFYLSLLRDIILLSLIGDILLVLIVGHSTWIFYLPLLGDILHALGGTFYLPLLGDILIALIEGHSTCLY